MGCRAAFAEADESGFRVLTPLSGHVGAPIMNRLRILKRLPSSVISNVTIILLASGAWLAPLDCSRAEDAAARITAADTEIAPELVSYPAGEYTLKGYLWKPAGKGPFPAVIYNHGSEKNPTAFPPLGKYYTAKGFVFFVPHRHGHGNLPGDYIVDLEQKFRSEHTDAAAAQKYSVSLHEKYNLDVEAAVKWLSTQPYVNTNQMVMSGISYGGIQTVLAAEKDLGLKACIPFSPAAMSWRGNPVLRARLLKAVENAKVPVFLLQAENDYNLGPSQLLGTELKRKGAPNQSKIYPSFGDPEDHRAGHGGFAVRGSEVWGKDVATFLEAVLKAPTAPDKSATP